MARMKIKLDPAGISEIWDILAPQVGAAGKSIASKLPAEQEPGTLERRDRKGRPVCLVAMRTPEALKVQARTGVLTRAAAELGLDVKRYSGG